MIYFLPKAFIGTVYYRNMGVCSISTLGDASLTVTGVRSCCHGATEELEGMASISPGNLPSS
jgi:hypothetical protein